MRHNAAPDRTDQKGIERMEAAGIGVPGRLVWDRQTVTLGRRAVPRAAQSWPRLPPDAMGRWPLFCKR